MRGGFGDAEDAAEIVADEHRNGEGTFHPGGLGGRAGLAGSIGLEIADGDRLPALGGEAGDAFANGNGGGNLRNVRRDAFVGDELEHAVAQEMDGASLAAKVADSGSEDDGGIAGGKGGF